MARNEIEYRVEVDSSGAKRGLSDFSRAAQKAGKDAAKSLDDTATAGDKARAALEQMAQAMDAELREAAAAADALKVALGESADQFDANRVVADLNRMGVGFDEIRADAGKFADTLRQVDGIRVQQVNDGLSDTKRALDDVRSSGDQSKSVLANLAGNAAQDLGELGGVAGTAGVALGQLAEYATEGNISLGNFAKIAGPMAGVTAGMVVMQKVMGNIAASKAFEADQVEAYSEAIKESGTGMETLEGHIRSTGELLARVAQTNPLGRLFDMEETKDLSVVLGNMGVTLEEVMGIIEAGPMSLDEYRDALRALGVEEGELDHAVEAVTQTQRLWTEAVADTEGTVRFFAPTLQSMQEALDGLADPLTKQPALWDALARDVADGTIDWENAADAVKILAEETGLSTDEIIAMAKAQADADVEAFADALVAAAEGAAAGAASMQEYNDAVKSADYGAAAYEGALVAGEKFFEFAIGDARRVVDQQAAYDDLAESIGEAGDGLINMSTGEGRQAFAALDNLGSTIIPDIAQAFDDADGDLATFKRNMDVVRRDTLTGLTQSFVDLGDSNDEAREKAVLLLEQIGLTPAEYETMYTLAGTEEAILKIGLLQGFISTLDKDVQAEIAYQISVGDYVGAVNRVEQEAANANATIHIDADVSAALRALEALRRMIAVTNTVIRVGATSQSVSGQSAPMSAAARGVGVAPAAAAVVPVNVHVHAAVVGNRYDVERVVTGAVRQSIRLAGRRQLQVAR